MCAYVRWGVGLVLVLADMIVCGGRVECVYLPVCVSECAR